MRLLCWYCHKSVSSELPEDSIFRCLAICPECIEKSPEAQNHPLEISEPSLRGQVRDGEEEEEYSS